MSEPRRANSGHSAEPRRANSGHSAEPVGGHSAEPRLSPRGIAQRFRGENSGHSALRRRAGYLAAALGATLLSGLLTVPAADAAPVQAPPVTISVNSVSPSTPRPSNSKQPLTFELTLTNTSAKNLGKVTVEAVRGTPIEHQRGLARTLAHPVPPDPTLASPIDPEPNQPVTARLGPHTSVPVTYRTSTEIPTDAGLCLCHNAIYPIYFTASYQADGGTVELAHAQTYLPAFEEVPKPVRVSWIWPLVDRPHRLSSDNVFTDDSLAASISGGRLDRMLQVVETVGAQVPMTLVVDPELIDELAIMSHGYHVEQGIGPVVAGTGQLAAQQWLARLRTVLDYPSMELDFTAPADPDVGSLTRHGLSWSNKLDAAAHARVQAVLGGRTPSRELAWPADGVLRSQTLDALAAQGTRTVVVSDTSLPGGGHDGSAPNALASLATTSGKVHAIVTASAIQRYVAPVLSRGGTGLAQLPELVSEVAIRAEENLSKRHYIAIAAPRDLDPDPTVAARALLDTATAFWARPVPVGAAVTRVAPVGHGRLVTARPRQVGLPAAVITAGQQISSGAAVLRALLSGDRNATAIVSALPDAIQRLESISWLSDPVGASTLATMLSSTITSMSDGVHLVQPSRGAYTLASSNSPLPITIENDLDYTVTVRVDVRTVNGLAGLTATPQPAQVAPHTKVTVRVPTQVERTGRMHVVAQLLTTDGVALGTPLYLSVRSTALGGIGVIITIVAGVVLALALLVRFCWRWRQHWTARTTARSARQRAPASNVTQ